MKNSIKLNKDISYLAGVFAGDGHLHRYISKKRTDYKVEIFGDKENDLEYFQFLSNLLRKYFKLEPRIKHKKDPLCLCLNYRQVLEFFESIGIPVGKKCKIVEIPYVIKKDRTLVYSFIRGFADSDFSITFVKAGRKKHSYPRITIDLASEKMIKDVIEVLKKIGISYSAHKRIKNNFNSSFTHYSLDIYGKRNLKKWLEYIGFSNIKHTSKIDVYRKLGYCPPHTSLERKRILSSYIQKPSENQRFSGFVRQAHKPAKAL